MTAKSARALAASATGSEILTPECGKFGFVDTHCHLDSIMPRLAAERKKLAKKAKDKGKEPPPPAPKDFDALRASFKAPEDALEACITIGCSPKKFDAVEAFLKHEGVYGAFGVHPLYADQWSDSVEDKICELMSRDKVVAWGECGLDYYDKDNSGVLEDAEKKELQRSVFERQIELAVKFGKPLIVHTRSADDDTWELLSRHLPESHPVHVHCFTSSPELAAKLLERFPNLNLGFTGVVSFKNAGHVKDVVRDTPLDRILLETDGPYMAPVPFRGKTAHPGHVAYVAQAIADVKGLPVSDIFCQCRENTRRLYGV